MLPYGGLTGRAILLASPSPPTYLKLPRVPGGIKTLPAAGVKGDARLRSREPRRIAEPSIPNR